MSEINDVFESGHYDSPLGYDNVNWFVNEMTNLEYKTAFYFKNTNKDIIMTEEDDDGYKEYYLSIW